MPPPPSNPDRQRFYFFLLLLSKLPSCFLTPSGSVFVLCCGCFSFSQPFSDPARELFSECTSEKTRTAALHKSFLSFFFIGVGPLPGDITARVLCYFVMLFFFALCLSSVDSTEATERYLFVCFRHDVLSNSHSLLLFVFCL